MLAKNALQPIEKKLKGLYSTASKERGAEREISTSNLVQMLIQEATSPANLVSSICHARERGHAIRLWKRTDVSLVV